jgi:hypothetical protein
MAAIGHLNNAAARPSRPAIDWMNITVVLVGNRSGMRIVDLKPRIVARESMSDGAYLKAAGGSGEAGTVELRADLDKAAPRFAWHPGGSENITAICHVPKGAGHLPGVRHLSARRFCDTPRSLRGGL